MQSKYLIIGSSHAALEAATAIRLIDPDGALTLVTRDARLPYSPTILPYVVSGRSQPDAVTLRDAEYFRANALAFVPDATVVKVDPAQMSVRLASGELWQYERLLIATGAAPALPPIEGLRDTAFHVLRSMADAVKLRDAIGAAKSALVLGAGLIGMHAVENMRKAGVAVTVVELQAHALSGYFEPEASAIIEGVFANNGVRMLMGQTIQRVARDGDGCIATLLSGETLAADLLLVCAGVKPNIDFLDGSGIEVDHGILVGDAMRSSVPNVWAAGDVAQARGFYGGKVINGILPSAVEQGRIAGLAMAGDPQAQAYAGAVPLNTYHFFGQQAISVGDAAEADGVEIEQTIGERAYRRIALKDGNLVGIATINDFVDAGIMEQLIRRRTDLTAVKSQFVADPKTTGRRLMSQFWR